MKMTNDTYCVVLHGKRTTERYYRDRRGWLKISNQGREFRMTPEQVLNHLLPALAFGEKLGLSVKVEHYDGRYWETVASADDGPVQPGDKRVEIAPDIPVTLTAADYFADRDAALQKIAQSGG